MFWGVLFGFLLHVPFLGFHLVVGSAFDAMRGVRAPPLVHRFRVSPQFPALVLPVLSLTPYSKAFWFKCICLESLVFQGKYIMFWYRVDVIPLKLVLGGSISLFLASQELCDSSRLQLGAQSRELLSLELAISQDAGACHIIHGLGFGETGDSPFTDSSNPHI